MLTMTPMLIIKLYTSTFLQVHIYVMILIQVLRNYDRKLPDIDAYLIKRPESAQMKVANIGLSTIVTDLLCSWPFI